MTVAELIEQLQRCDSKATVVIDENFVRYVEATIVSELPDGCVLID